MKVGDKMGECEKESDMKKTRLALLEIKDLAKVDMVEMTKAGWNTDPETKKKMQKEKGVKEDPEQKWEDFWKEDETNPMHAIYKEYVMKIEGCHNVAASITAGAAALT